MKVSEAFRTICPLLQKQCVGDYCHLWKPTYKAQKLEDVKSDKTEAEERYGYCEYLKALQRGGV